MSGPGSQDTATLRWLADVIDCGRPVAFTLNWVHSEDLGPPPMGHGHAGRLASVQGYHSTLNQEDGRILAEEAADRLQRARDSAWMEPLRGLQLLNYTLRDCLIAAACCGRVPPQRWGELATLLYMRSGRGNCSFSMVLEYLGYNPTAVAAFGSHS